MQTSILKEEEPTEIGAAYTSTVARIAISACVAGSGTRAGLNHADYALDIVHIILDLGFSCV